MEMIMVERVGVGAEHHVKARAGRLVQRAQKSADLGIIAVPAVLDADATTILQPEGGDIDPRGLLAGKNLVERVKDSLAIWLKQDDAYNRQLFLDANKDPVLLSEGDHGWELEFNFFNVNGGVEAWKVTGDHAAIESADRTALLPDHTFFWPMA